MINTNDDDDRDLQEYFAAVRRDEAARVPPISRLRLATHKEVRGGLSSKLAFTAACLAALIAAAVWLLPGSRVAHEGSNRGREQAAASITSWKPDTDFLLNTPGRELLEGVPAIGEWHDLVNVPVSGESHRPFKKQIFHKEELP
jgi:hypothetical protein